MSSVAMIINSLSSRNIGIVDDLLKISSQHENLRPYVIEGVHGLNKAIQDIARSRSDTIIICGGDGTTQAILTSAINSRLFEHVPKIVVLPCGMTNIVASDCGLRGAPSSALENFLRRHSLGEVHEVVRPMIELQLSKNQLPIFGFFFGGGMFHSAVEFSREKVQALGVKRSLALGLGAGGFIVKTAFDKSEKPPPLPAKISGADGEFREVDLSLLMMTTLNRLSLGIFPFWGEEEGPMSVLAIDYPPQKIFRAAFPVLTGRGGSWLASAGYRSWRTDEMRIRADAPFVFDGEIYQSTPAEDLTLKCSQDAVFLV